MNNFSLFLILFWCLPVLAVDQVSLRAVCVEKEESLLKEFFPLSIEKDRTTTGQDQVETLRARIQSFISSQPQIKITKISVNSLSARIPFYVQQAGKKIIDPQSDQKNSGLARDRAAFAETLLVGMKSNVPELKDSVISIESGLGGPVFSPQDLNDRFVTVLTPNYRQRVEDFYQLNQAIYEEVALQTDAEKLFDEAKFPNLFQVKFKPFQGIRLEISGIKKCAGKKASDSPAVIKQ